MQLHVRAVLVTAALALLVAGAPSVVSAQAALGPAPRPNVISANPFGLLLNLFNAEYERALTESVTLGVGGSFGSGEDEDESGVIQETSHFNGDVFARFYPSGRPFEGWNFGAKIGVTRQEGWSESSTNMGYGFDANYSWLLGANDNFYLGLGFGLKRLIGDLPEGTWRVVPTFRIINVGFAF